MIKGINRQIIEVNNPKPDCFERVILFLNAEAEMTPTLVDEQTERYLALLSTHYHRRERLCKRLQQALFALLFLLLGSGVTALCFLLL